MNAPKSQASPSKSQVPAPQQRYSIIEIFYSIQGEGHRAGTANVFIRFAGCNLQCTRGGYAGFDCDTIFTGGKQLTLEEIEILVEEIRKGCNSIILTGGEPALQVDEHFVTPCKDRGFFIAIETNGTRDLPKGINFLTVSPKSADHTIALDFCDELKIVLPARHFIPKYRIKALHKFVSPVFSADMSMDHESLNWCIEQVKENPDWRLSVQQHKLWNVR